MYLLPKLILFCALVAARIAALSPSSLRVDLHPNHGALITLDEIVTGVSPNISLSWGLPSGIALQRASRVWVTTPAAGGANTTVFDSGWIVSPATPWLQPGAAQVSGIPRSILRPATAYDWTVSVRDATGVVSSFAEPQRFFTSAGAAAWAASTPIWAPSCSGSSPPSFAYFFASLPIAAPPASKTLLSALLYVTGTPPIYNDPWNVTKIAGGYTLSVSGRLRGTGPGKAACGPVAMSDCTPVQPYDGFDVSAEVMASMSSKTGLDVGLVCYAITQKAYGLVPAAQAVLVMQWDDGTTTTIGTDDKSGSAWKALDADSLVNPSGNKAPFWYTQPREDAVTACLPPLSSKDATPATLNKTVAAGCSSCGWVAPVAVQNAYAGATLAGKATQATALIPDMPAKVTTQLGAGWWVLDPGFEIQGGVNALLGANAATAGAVVIVQLGEELAVNGSARWHLRAGCSYQDRWTFPASGAPAEQFAYSHHEFSEFRYAEIIVLDALTGAPLDIPLYTSAGSNTDGITVDFWRVHYPYDDATATVITTSDPDVNAVWDMAQFTLKTTTLDMYSDSSTRQRSFDCMADDTTAALSHYSTTSELAFPRFAAAQIMSTMNGGYISPNWADWTVLPGLNIVNDALYTGDLSFAEKYFDLIVANHTYSWLIDPALGVVKAGWLGALVDTSGGPDDGFQSTAVNSVVNAWSYLGLRSAAMLGRWLGRNSTAASLDATADSLETAFSAVFFNGTDGVCDGRCSQTPHSAFHSTFYALMAGLFDNAPGTADALASALAARVVAEGDNGVPCGTYPVQFLLGAFYRVSSNHGTSAHGVLTARTRHSWMNMIETYGATSTMECWTPEELDNLSFSHVWSSSPSIMVPQGLFGVTPTAPGWAKMRIAPQPGPVRSGSLSMVSVRGPISVRFIQGGETPGTAASCMSIDVDIPGGAAAHVLVPRWGQSVTVTVDGVAASSSQEGDYAAVDVGPGAHTVTTC